MPSCLARRHVVCCAREHVQLLNKRMHSLGQRANMLPFSVTEEVDSSARGHALEPEGVSHGLTKGHATLFNVMTCLLVRQEETCPVLKKTSPCVFAGGTPSRFCTARWPSRACTSQPPSPGPPSISIPRISPPAVIPVHR